MPATPTPPDVTRNRAAPNAGGAGAQVRGYHVAIICHLERIYPHDYVNAVNENHYCFGLNISTSFKEDDGPVKFDQEDIKFLKPWDWAKPENLAIAISLAPPTANPPAVLNPQAIAAYPYPHDSVGGTTLIAELENTIPPPNDTAAKPTALVIQQAGLFWDPAEQVAIDAASPKLQALLGQLTVDSAPVPQLLNLSVAFWLTQTQLTNAGWKIGDSLVAVPYSVIAGGAEVGKPSGNLAKVALNPAPARGGRGARRPIPTTRAATTQLTANPPANSPPAYQDIYCWDYNTKAHGMSEIPPIKAYVNATTLDLRPTPPAGCGDGMTFIDLRTYWVHSEPFSPAAVGNMPATTQPVTRQAQADTSPQYWQDWITPLQDRFITAFDESQRLIDALRYLQNLSDEDLSGFRPAIFHALRKLAPTGVGTAPDGQNLLDLAMAGVTDDPTTSRVPASAPASAPAAPTIRPDAGKAGVVKFLKNVGELPDENWADVVENAIPDAKRIGTFKPVRPITRENVLADMEQLHAALSDDDALVEVVFQVWTQLGKGDAAISDYLKKHEAEIRAGLRGLPIRRRLAAENITPLWKRIQTIRTSSAPLPANPVATQPKDHNSPLLADHDFVFAAFKDELEKHVRSDLRSLPQPTQERVVRESLGPYIADFGDRYLFQSPVVARAVHAAAPVDVDPESLAGDDSPTQYPHAVTLQVDRLCGLNVDPLGADDDYLRRIAGFGMLVAQAPYVNGRQWRCPNMAQISVQTTTNVTLLAKIAFVPNRLGYRDGLRQTCLTYDNQPLAAISPSTQLAQNSSVVARGTDESDKTIRRVLRYDAVLSGTIDPLADWSKLVALKFGETYHFAVFVRGNNGALPRELVKKADDMTERHPAAMMARDQFNDERIAPYIRTVKYLRRVPIGEVRFSAAAFLGTLPPATLKEQLPALPAGVTPLARDLGVTAARSFNVPESYYFRDGQGMLSLLPANGQAPADWNVVLRGVQPARRTTDAWGLPEQRSLRIAISPDPNAVEFGGSEADDFWIELAYARTAESDGLQCLRVKLPNQDPAAVTPKTPADVAGLPPRSFDVQLSMAFDKSPPHPAGKAPSVPPGIICVRVTPGGEDPKTNSSIWSFAVKVIPVSWRHMGVRIRAIEGLTFRVPQAEIGDSAIESTRSNDVPLLVLGPDRPAGFKFEIRRPATDVVTWDRWISKDFFNLIGSPTADKDLPPLRREDRINVWTNSFTEADTPKSTDLARRNWAIADPATYEGFFVELVPLRTTGAAKPRENYYPLFPPSSKPSDGDPTFPRFNTPLPFHVIPIKEGSANLSAPPTGNGAPQVDVTIPAGEIWELRIFPLVRSAYFDDPPSSNVTGAPQSNKRFFRRFRAGFRKQTIGIGEGQLSEFVLCTPFQLICESPSLTLPNQESVWRAMRPNYFSTDSPERRIAELGLDFTQITHAEENAQIDWDEIWKFEFVSQIQVLRQLWRPTGRPISPIPLVTPDHSADPSAANRAITDCMTWESEAFADRYDWDHLTTTTLLRPGDRRPTDSQIRAEGVNSHNPVVFQDDISQDTRALYYRFGLIAYSRYAQWFNQLQVMAAFAVHDANSKVTTPWRRLFVPCTYDGNLVKPCVHFVVPLTESQQTSERLSGVGSPSQQNAASRPASKKENGWTTTAPSNGPTTRARAVTATGPGPAGRRTPGVLLVLDEEWHAKGGLAETLGVDIEMVTWARAQGEYYPQFGPDPLFHTRGWNPRVPVAIAESGIEGPIGFTFDESQLNPLFVNSSFVLSPPDIPPLGLTPFKADSRIEKSSAAKPPSEPSNRYADGTLAWYFAKMRFRRRLDPEATAEKPVQPNPTSLPASNDTIVNLVDPDAADRLRPLAPQTQPSKASRDDPAPRFARSWAVYVSEITLPPTPPESVLPAISLSLPVDPPAFVGVQFKQIAAKSPVIIEYPDQQDGYVLAMPTGEPGSVLGGAPVTVSVPDDIPKVDLRWLIEPADDAPPEQDQGQPSASIPEQRPRYSISLAVRVLPDSKAPQDSMKEPLPLPRWQAIASRVCEVASNAPIFTATIRTAGWAGALGPPKVLPLRQSDPTQAYWVQYLPDAPKFEPPSGLAGVVTYNPLHGELMIPSDLQLFDDFIYVAVVTFVVSDASRLPDQERYLGLFSVNASTLRSVMKPAPVLLDGANIRIRILQVQHQRGKKPDLSTESMFWNALFPQSQTIPDVTDVSLRVVAMSAPVDVEVNVLASAPKPPAVNAK